MKRQAMKLSKRISRPAWTQLELERVTIDQRPGISANVRLVSEDGKERKTEGVGFVGEHGAAVLDQPTEDGETLGEALERILLEVTAAELGVGGELVAPPTDPS